MLASLLSCDRLDELTAGTPQLDRSPRSCSCAGYLTLLPKVYSVANGRIILYGSDSFTSQAPLYDRTPVLVGACAEYGFAICTETDKDLMPPIRDLGLSDQRKEKTYRNLVIGGLQGFDVHLNDFLKDIHENSNLAALLNTMPHPDLTINIDDNLGKITYSSDGKKHHVTNPQLLWDCYCRTAKRPADTAKCPIHRCSWQKDLTDKFNNSFVMIGYKGMKFLWKNLRVLWPPSIDSLLMLSDLEADGFFNEEYESVLDLGSGTGFLGITAALRNPYAGRVVLSDWLLTPMLFGLVNWRLNSKEKDYLEVHVKAG